MRAVVQRTESCSVNISGKLFSEIGNGMLILLGIEDDDAEEDAGWLVRKISQMRIFDDQNGVMNFSLDEAGGEAMVVSQFTLHASVKKGNRPSYIRAARPEKAIALYEYFIHHLQQSTEKQVKNGQFGAMMKVSLVNDGPVTIIMDSKNRE